MRGISVDLGLVRHQRGMSQRRLADLAGVRPATIADIERGKTQGIEFDTLAKICIALDCTPNDILVLEDSPHIVPILGGPDEDEIIAERLEGLDLDAIANMDPREVLRGVFDDDEDYGGKTTEPVEPTYAEIDATMVRLAKVADALEAVGHEIGVAVDRTALYRTGRQA